jgi:hypothetical protein
MSTLARGSRKKAAQRGRDGRLGSAGRQERLRSPASRRGSEPAQAQLAEPQGARLARGEGCESAV